MLNSTDTTADGIFILATDSPFNWQSPQNNNLGQGVNGTNNPCPVGYRLPTQTEWNAERLSWSSNNAVGDYSSSLKLPMTGYRISDNGLLNYVGWDGLYWASTVDGIYSGN